MHIGKVIGKKKLPRVRSLRRPVLLLTAAEAPIPVPPDWPKKRVDRPAAVVHDRR